MKKNIVKTILIFAVALFSIAFVSAQEQYNCPMGGGMMYGTYGGYGAGIMLFSWVTWILTIALIVAGIYWLIKNANKKK